MISVDFRPGHQFDALALVAGVPLIVTRAPNELAGYKVDGSLTFHAGTPTHVRSFLLSKDGIVYTAWYTDVEHMRIAAVDLGTGRSVAHAELLPEPPAVGTDWRIRQPWVREHLRPLYATISGRKRVVGDDATVVMTGAVARQIAPLVLGPGRAAHIVKAKGIKTGRVVICPRAGDPRVMALGGGANPIALMLAGDGLTVTAACRRGYRVVDLDV